MTSFADFGPRPVDRDHETSLWRQVHADLLRRVELGEFTDEFPGELALVAQYQVSRHTVREAVRRLREAGVVTAGRGRTPRVSSPVEIDQSLGSLYSLFSSVRAVGLAQTSLVLTLDQRHDSAVASRLNLPATTELFYLSRLRMAGEEPLALDQVWMPLELASPLLEADFSETAVYIELSTRCGIQLTAGTENIRAVIPTPAEQVQLQLPPGEAALAIQRLGYHHDNAIEWRHTLVRGDRFAVHTDFSAAAGYRLAGQLHRPTDANSEAADSPAG